MTDPVSVGTPAEPVTDPQVAVILPTYNGVEFIGEQLNALFDQRANTPWHLIVVDSGSSDGTLDVVEGFRPTTVPMSIVQLGEPLGVNAALNAGIASTTSEKLLIAEHDDVVAEGWMAALVDALDEFALVGSHMDRHRLNQTDVVGSRSRFPEDPQFAVPVAASTGLGFRRAVWREVGGFDETYRYGGNDLEFCFRVHSAGYPVRLVDDALVYYRIRPGVGEAFRQAQAYGVSTVRVYRQFGPEFLRRRSLRAAGREVVRLGWWSVKSIRRRDYRHRLAFRGGLQLGFLEGSIRFRRWFP